MAFTDLPAQYVFLFYLTIILLAVKAITIVITLNRFIAERKKPEKVPLGFIFAVFLFYVSLFTSRLLFTAFDFFTTGFDMAFYTAPSNLFLHKAGLVASTAGMGFMVWVADRRIMLNKFKGFPAMIIFAGAFILAFFPIREGTIEDFELYSLVGIVLQLPAVIILGIFIWMGIVAPRLRRIAWALALGQVMYAYAAIIVNASVISPLVSAFGPWIPYLIYTIAISSKVAAIFMMLYVALNFMKLNSALVDYYQSKRICVVHRGVITGRVFMCGSCRIFYCIPCRDAIVDLENKCWNCGDTLSRGRELPKDDDTAPNGTSKKKESRPETGTTPEITVEGRETAPGKAPKKGVVAGEEPSKAGKKSN